MAWISATILLVEKSGLEERAESHLQIVQIEIGQVNENGHEEY